MIAITYVPANGVMLRLAIYQRENLVKAYCFGHFLRLSDLDVDFMMEYKGCFAFH